MALVFYNSLTQKKEEFLPLVSSQVKIYSCGVTVYDDCHIGHARSLFIFETLRRYLQHKGFQVTFVRNITDVDDKIINRSRTDGVPFDEIRVKYISGYLRDLRSLGIPRADVEPLATDNVALMVDHIRRLILRQAAYEVDGDVYFSVRSFPGYGSLSGQSIDDMRNAVRIDPDEKKRDPLDFALWKKSKEGDPWWDSPWGKGRPGWHIECSAMSVKYLKTETLDIHAGGRDLIFPHHENEIAQAEALTGKPFARYWIHHGLLTIDGRKMSKSLGNFITIQDVVAKYPPDVVKLYFLGAHYGSAMDFSYQGLDMTQRAYTKIQEFLARVDAAATGSARDEEVLLTLKESMDACVKEFEAAMDDDLNTARALAAFFELMNIGNKALADSQTAPEAVRVAKKMRDLGKLFGLQLKAAEGVRSLADGQRLKISANAVDGLSETEVTRLIEERRQARLAKDYRRADEIRDFLKTHGVIVEDTKKSS